MWSTSDTGTWLHFCHVSQITCQRADATCILAAGQISIRSASTKLTHISDRFELSGRAQSSLCIVCPGFFLSHVGSHEVGSLALLNRQKTASSPDLLPGTAPAGHREGLLDLALTKMIPECNHRTKKVGRDLQGPTTTLLPMSPTKPCL